MNLCSGSRYNSHDEICYEGNECPLCLLMEERDEVEKQLNEEIERLKAEL